MHRNRSVDVHQFAMVPKAEIPRSAFRMQKTYKTSFDSGYLIPFHCMEVLPGDTISLRATMFGRLATPIFPVMDNLHMDTFFFFCPNRLVWSHWVNFMGEQLNPADSISYTIPQQVSPNGGYAVGSLQDYFGLPTVGQVTGGVNVTHSALPLRMYNLIWREWFRDENLQNSPTVDTGDGPDTVANYVLLRRGKRHDYFTSCLPWPQKGGTAVTLPLGTVAPVMGIGVSGNASNVGAGPYMQYTGTTFTDPVWEAAVTGHVVAKAQTTGAPNASTNKPQVYADLSAATAATINQLRQAFQIQKYLERSARGGSRYVETIEAMFGVRPPDFRLQRPEYIGGGSTPIQVNPIAQTGQTGLTGGSTPLGTLGGMGTYLTDGNGYSYSATEHGYIIGLVSVRADLSYQQGLQRHWSRSTLYDFFNPVFSMLGEQAVLNKEIYCVGSASGGAGAADQDMAVFGYQERWAEYRYDPSQITGLFRSTSAGTIDPWHLSQKFTSLPTLNTTFIQDTPPLSRVLAVGAAANGQQLLLDAFLDIHAARPMPLYSVPGLIDHF